MIDGSFTAAAGYSLSSFCNLDATLTISSRLEANTKIHASICSAARKLGGRRITPLNWAY